MCAKLVGNIKSNLARILVNGSFQWISGDRLIKNSTSRDACSCSGNMVMKGTKPTTCLEGNLSVLIKSHLRSYIWHTLVEYQQLMLPNPPLPVLLCFRTGPTIVHRHESGARAGKLCTKGHTYLLACYMCAISLVKI